MNKLYPVKHIRKREFSGKLLIDGDLQDNCILFRFLFDRTEMVHPLFIRIKAMPIIHRKCPGRRYKQYAKTFTFGCNVPDSSNPVMKTRLLFPVFALKEHRIRVTCIESQISMECFGGHD